MMSTNIAKITEDDLQSVSDYSFGGQENNDDDDDQEIGHKARQEEERKELAGTGNNKAVGYLRLAVYIVVVVTALLVCILVYVIAKKDEQTNFEDNFAAFADKLVESFNNEVEVRIGAINSLSTAITTFALSSGATFPNVTVRKWETRKVSLH